MKGNHHVGALFLLMILAAALQLFQFVRASASAEALSIQPGQRKYVRDYVEAIKSGDLNRLKALIHPKVLVCINDQTRDFFEDMFARTLREKVTDNYRIVRVAAVNKNRPSFELFYPAGMLFYPVQPTHAIQIDFETDPYHSLTLIREIVLLNGTWREVAPCPTAKGLEAFREARLAKEKRTARARELAASLHDPLLSQLRELLKQQRMVEAMKKYSAETGEDLTTTREVLELIDAGKQ